MRWICYPVFCVSLWLHVIPVYGTHSSPLMDLDSTVYKALKIFNTPGIAIGVVVDGEVVLSKGYGSRDLKKNDPVTENTLFSLASGTKPFTSFLLGQLVEEGKISWDDPVQMHLPEFRFCNGEQYPPVTIRNLLSHCSGLPRHDLVWYNASFERNEILGKLTLLEQNFSPGTKFQYNNMTFSLGGMILERLTGQTWEEALANQILTPLSMKNTNTSTEEMKMNENFSHPYIWGEDGITSIPIRPMLTAPSAAINSSISDMCKWLQLLVKKGSLEKKNLLSEEIFNEICSLQMLEDSLDSVFCFEPIGVGLGWMMGNYKDKLVLYHGGYTEGFVSLTAILPKENMGFVMLCNTNSADYFLTSALTHTILSSLLDLEKKDWISLEKSKYDAKMAALPIYELTEETSMFFHGLEGRYDNPAYGAIDLCYREGHPILIFHEFEHPLQYEHDNTFTVLSGVPAYPQITWNGMALFNHHTKKQELHIHFEPAADPIVFSSCGP